MRRIQKYSISVISIAFLLYYPLTWIISQMIWYERDLEDVYVHDPLSVEGLDLLIWNGPTNSKCSISYYCPLIKTCVYKGPHYIGLSFFDENKTVIRLRINKANIICDVENRINLELGSRDFVSNSGWIYFREDAAKWVLHVNDEKKLMLGDSAIVEIDFSMERGGEVISNRLNVQLVKKIRLKKGWVALGSWL